jgi:hypothetical protein
VQEAKNIAGIKTTLATIAAPKVVPGGHVAGWVGVGGPGMGPTKEDEWLQIGYSGFPGGKAQIYYEVTLPGKDPKYNVAKASLSSSEKHTISVSEVAGKNGTWRAYLDGKAVGSSYSLPGSHGKFPPQAIGETWSSSGGCNGYGYDFTAVNVLKSAGGSWTQGKAGYQWRDSNNQLVKESSTAFRTRSTTSASAGSADEPALLGAIASTLAGRTLHARCVPQGPQAKVTADRLDLNETVCETLLGYAVAQPWGPKATTRAGLAVARVALAYLRGVSQAAGLSGWKLDCQALKGLASAFRSLGATGTEALDLRARLKRDGGSAVKLALAHHCQIH